MRKFTPSLNGALHGALLGALILATAAGASAQTRLQPAKPTPPGLTLQKQAPKPDFVIEHASAIGGSNNQFMVKVKNAGAVNSPAAKLRSGNKTPGNNGVALSAIPAIKAGQHAWVKVELSKPARPGDRILVEADYNKAVAETKEKNNNYAFNW
ncbi:MAG: hypothetical protein Tsb0032_07520 [Kiloniellaceae bacterium]